MKKIWHDLGRTQERRIEADFRGLRIPFSRRIDAVWFLLLFAVLFLLVVWWLVGVVVGQWFGVFEAPAIQPVADRRILTNIRDNIREHPLLDAVYHQPEGCIYISRKGGTLHRYNPSTGLWATETPFSGSLKNEMLEPDIVLLRSGCGTDPLSNRLAECPDVGTIWGVTANGGLVRRSQGRWEVVKSDSVFIGSRGQPVGEGEMTAAAVSGDREWLVVGTKQNGIGVYHLKTHRWLQLQEDFLRKLPSPTVTHIAWCQDRFWIGGPGGLVSLQPDFRLPAIYSLPEITGIILDLETDPAGRLWVLEKRKCRGGGMNCLRLSRFLFQYEGQAPELLMDENDIYPDLTLEDLHFACYWGDRKQNRLIAAGNAGVFSYDARLHSWERHSREAVTAILPFPEDEDRGFYFGYTGGIGVVSEDRHQPWKKPNKRCTAWLLPVSYGHEKIVKLELGRYGSRDDLLVRGISGTLFAIDKKDTEKGKDKSSLRVVFQGERSALEPGAFRSAVAFGDNVIFSGGQNQDAPRVMIHNIIKRTYKDVPLSTLPDWLRHPDLKIAASGDQVYVIVQRKWDARVYRIPSEDAAEANFRAAVSMGMVPGVVVRVDDWEGRGIGLLTDSPDGGGRLFRFAPQWEALTGLKARDINVKHAPILDAAPYDRGKGIIIATFGGLLHYDYSSRSWVRYFRYSDKSVPREVVYCNNKLLMSTRQGRLVELTAAGKFQGRIGGERGFDIPGTLVSDVLVKGDGLYIAGNGWINLYDTSLRRITDRWKMPGSGEVVLVDVIRGQPLALCSGIATMGTQILDPRAGRVLSLSTDNDSIWAVRQKISGGRETRYLKKYPRDDPFSLTAQCYFYNPYAGQGLTGIFDAATLPDGTLAVSTNQGLRFYSPASRSWFRRVLRDPIPAGSRGGELFVTDRYMVSVTEKGEDLELSTVELGSFRLPASHTDDPVLLGGTLRKVRALTVDPVGGRMAFIDQDGTIFEWHGGVELEILPPTKNEPLSSSLKRVYERISITGKFGQSGFLLFTTDTMKTLQRYDLDRRSWSEIRLNIPALPGDDSLADMDISDQVDRSLEYIVAKSRKGKFYVGSFVSPRDARDVKRVELRPLFSPGTGLDARGSDLRDVQQRGQGYWTFVLSDRIKYYDPVKRQWSEEILLPGMKSFTYYHLQDRGVIVSDSPGGQTWWVAHQAGPHPPTFAGYTLKPGETETTALDDSGTIWRLPPGGTLYRVPLPAGGNYDPPGTAHEIPFAVDARKIRGAYEWGRRILFDTPEGIRVLDTVLRNEIPLKGPAGNLAGIKEALAEERQVWIRTGTDRLLLLVIMADNTLEWRILPGTITALAGAVERIQGAAPGSRLENKWGRLKQKVVRLANGQEAYDPVLGLVRDKTGALMMQRPGGPEKLAAHGELKFGADKLAPALDAGWLRWKRNTRTFEIKTPTKTLTMTPDEFIKDKKLLFEDIDAILAKDSNRWCAANRYGIWNHTGKDLSLADPALTFQPMSWSPPLGAAHGVFITGDGPVDANGKAVPAARQDYRVVFGDVTLIEDTTRGGVRARVKIANKPGSIDAFAYRGFTWDQDKRGLAYGDAGLLVQSAAGIHPVESFTGFEAPPARAPQGRLYSRETGKLYVRQGQTWFQRSGPSQWTQTAANPRENRVMVDNATWKWELRNNELHVQLTGDPYDFKLIPGAAGFAFTADLLADAAAFNNRVMVMSGAFCEEASPASQLADLQASRSRPLPCRGLRVIRYASGPDDLLLHSADGKEYYRWNTNSRRFEPVKDIGLFLGNSLLAAVPAAKPRLRFLRQAGGKIKKEVRVNDTAGILSWEPFDFQGIDNHFPFDGVTAIAAGKDELYVGTEAGLQVYAGNLDTGLGDIRAFYEFRGKSRGSPGLLEPVKNVGTPLNNPRVAIAYSSSQCIEKPEDGSFRVCRGPSRLDERLRFQTASWRFVERDGRVEGRYKDEKGRFSSEEIAIMDGRFPHDRIGDMAVHGNHVFTLWYSGPGTSTSWISRCSTRSVGFDQKEAVNYNTGFMGALRFIEVPHDIEVKGAVIAHGLYVEGRGARIWQYLTDGKPSQSWKEVRDPGVVGGILEYAGRPPIVTRKALRLLSPEQNKRSTPGQGVFTFEYRALDGQWRPLPWETEKNKVCIDHWTTFFCLDGRLWAAAPCGLVSFSRDPRGNVVLDADNFMVVPEPAIGDTILPVTAVTVENHKKKSVIIRCPGGAPYGYKGILDGKTDRDVFTPVPVPAAGKEVLTDTRREKVQVGLGEEGNGFWEWVTMTTGPANTDTQPGRLKGRLRGEEIRLVGGRFAFDGIDSIAFFQKDRVEIGTDSGGWYQVTLPAEEWQGAGDFHLSRFQRPRTPGVNPALVKEVRTNRTGAEQNEQVLGLRIPGEGFIRVGKEGVIGRTETFPQFLGSDGFWQYLKVDSNDVEQDSVLSIIALNPLPDKKGNNTGTAPGPGGRAKRRLETGRFTDDIVLGLPVGDANESGLYYLVPTRAGVLRLDSALNPLNIYTTASLNVPAGVSSPSASASDSAPAVLFVDRRSTPQQPLYLDRDGFHTLTAPGASPYLSLTPHVPPGAVVMAVEEGPQDFVRARWKIKASKQPGKQPGQRDYEKEQRGWVLFDTGKEKPRHEEPNTLYVNLRDFKAFRKSRQSQPWMRVRFTANQVEFLRYGAEEPYKMNLPEPLELLAAFVKDKRLLLIGRTHLWEINLERAVK